MNKILRYSFVALLAMVMGKVCAQEVTFDFTVTDPTDETGKTSAWGFPAGSSNKQTEEQGFTYDGKTVKVAAPDGYYWHNKDHYILFGKQGAYLTLPAFDFDVERIDVEGTSGASTGIKQNIYVGEEAVSTGTTGAQNVTNQFEIADGKQAAGTIYTIKVTSNHNNQIKTIKIWKKGTVPSGDEPGGDEPAADVKDATCAEIIAGEDGTKYRVTGTCTQIVNTTYGNWYLKDETGEVYVYGTLDAEGNSKNFSSLGIEVGDIVTVVGPKKTFNTTVELVDVTVEKIEKGQTPAEPVQTEEISVAKALEIINALEDGKTTTEEYQVKGFVVGTPDFQRNSSGELYGNVNFDMADTKGGTAVLTVFRAKNFEGANFTEETINSLKEGDEVVVKGKLQKYVKGDTMTPELAQGGKLISVNGSTTGIESVKAQDANAPIYNLAGQRVEKATKGIFIQNGKKFVVK